jgi:hypothetical protein
VYLCVDKWRQRSDRPDDRSTASTLVFRRIKRRLTADLFVSQSSAPVIAQTSRFSGGFVLSTTRKPKG